MTQPNFLEPDEPKSHTHGESESGNDSEKLSTDAALDKRVLIVEDEIPIREGVVDILKFHGFQVSEAGTGLSGLNKALEEQFSLIILDVMMPEIDGFEVARRLRAKGNETPIILLTARGSEEDILTGFRAGADDYVTKPFSIKELLARIEAILRRRPVVTESRGQFKFGPFIVDPRTHSAFLAKEPQTKENSIELTAREVAILAMLSEDAGHIVSRRRLLKEVWNMPNPDAVETRTVDMHIVKLRKKLGGPDQSGIETVRGEGYRLQI